MSDPEPNTSWPSILALSDRALPLSRTKSPMLALNFLCSPGQPFKWRLSCSASGVAKMTGVCNSLSLLPDFPALFVPFLQGLDCVRTIEELARVLRKHSGLSIPVVKHLFLPLYCFIYAEFIRASEEVCWVIYKYVILESLECFVVWYRRGLLVMPMCVGGSYWVSVESIFSVWWWW